MELETEEEVSNLFKIKYPNMYITEFTISKN